MLGICTIGFIGTFMQTLDDQRGLRQAMQGYQRGLGHRHQGMGAELDACSCAEAKEAQLARTRAQPAQTQAASPTHPIRLRPELKLGSKLEASLQMAGGEDTGTQKGGGEGTCMCTPYSRPR